MKIRKKNEVRTFLVVVVSLLITLLCMSVHTYAAGSIEVYVEYTPSEEALQNYKMKVCIEGDGYLLDGNQKISEPKVYELKAGTEKSFLLVKEGDAKVVSVTYDGEKITHKVGADNRLTVIGKEKDTELKISFSTNKKQSVSTGDDKSIGGYIMVITISVLALYMLVRYRKTQEEE